MKLGCTWDEIATRLECDRSMFFHVKAGRRALSDKALYRLMELEREEGITPPIEKERIGPHAPRAAEVPPLLSRPRMSPLNFAANAKRYRDAAKVCRDLAAKHEEARAAMAAEAVRLDAAASDEEAWAAENS